MPSSFAARMQEGQFTQKATTFSDQQEVELLLKFEILSEIYDTIVLEALQHHRYCKRIQNRFQSVVRVKVTRIRGKQEQQGSKPDRKTQVGRPCCIELVGTGILILNQRDIEAKGP